MKLFCVKFCCFLLENLAIEGTELMARAIGAPQNLLSRYSFLYTYISCSRFGLRWHGTRYAILAFSLTCTFITPLGCVGWPAYRPSTSTIVLYPLKFRSAVIVISNNSKFIALLHLFRNLFRLYYNNYKFSIFEQSVIENILGMVP